jgi:hypothetical protein
VRLIYNPTVTPKFHCLEDYGNSSVLEEWIKLSRPSQENSRFDQIRGLVEKINFDLAKAGKIEFQKIFWAGIFRDAWVARGGAEYLMCSLMSAI